MVAQARGQYVTPEEYLSGEAATNTKNEYVDGVIVAMSGASRQHVTIATNLVSALTPRMRAGGCRGYTSDMRVRVDTSNRYYYPDYAAVCGKPEFVVLQGVDSLVNPILIVEVLSDSTEQRDRGEKWLAYWEIETLRAYLLIHQDRRLIEVRTRDGDGKIWNEIHVVGLENALKLINPACEVLLAEIYEDVEFDTDGARRDQP